MNTLQGDDKGGADGAAGDGDPCADMAAAGDDPYAAFLRSLGREDVPAERVPELIEDAAGRLGLTDVDPCAVAAGLAEADVIAAIVSVIDFPPPHAELEMPDQPLGACSGRGMLPFRSRFWRRSH